MKFANIVSAHISLLFTTAFASAVITVDITDYDDTSITFTISGTIDGTVGSSYNDRLYFGQQGLHGWIPLGTQPGTATITNGSETGIQQATDAGAYPLLVYGDYIDVHFDDVDALAEGDSVNATVEIELENNDSFDWSEVDFSDFVVVCGYDSLSDFLSSDDAVGVVEDDRVSTTTLDDWAYLGADPWHYLAYEKTWAYNFIINGDEYYYLLNSDSYVLISVEEDYAPNSIEDVEFTFDLTNAQDDLFSDSTTVSVSIADSEMTVTADDSNLSLSNESYRYAKLEDSTGILILAYKNNISNETVRVGFLLLFESEDTGDAYGLYCIKDGSLTEDGSTFKSDFFSCIEENISGFEEREETMIDIIYCFREAVAEAEESNNNLNYGIFSSSFSYEDASD